MSDTNQTDKPSQGKDSDEWKEFRKIALPVAFFGLVILSSILWCVVLLAAAVTLAPVNTVAFWILLGFSLLIPPAVAWWAVGRARVWIGPKP